MSSSSSNAPGASGSGERSNAPLDQFMWCHGCRMEIIPLRTPHLTCPHCNESFIEEINGVPEADDVVFSSAPGPSHNAEDMYANEEQAQAGPLPWLRGGTVGGFTWAAAAGGSRNIRPLPNRSRARDDGMGGAGAAADGRMFNHDNDDDEEAEAERLNPPIFLGGRGLDALAGGVPPTLGEALRGFGGGGAFGAARPAGSGGGAGAAGGQGAGGLHPDLAHLRDLFANLFGDGVGDVFETFGAALGGRAGDYVFGDQGLSDVITGLMEQTQGQGSSAPPPASEESIEKLERFSRFNAEKLARARNHECPTCLDEFAPSAAAADKGKQVATEAMADDDDPPEVAPVDEDAQQEQLVLMPCQHVFHTDCLIPWLKKVGTCPSCRTALEPPTEAAGPSSSSSGARAAAAARPAAPPGAFSPPEEAGPINWNNFGDEDDFPLPHFRSMTTAQLRASHAQPQPFGITASHARAPAQPRQAHDGHGTQGDDTDEEWDSEIVGVRGGRQAAMERDRRTAQRERMPGGLEDDLDLD